MTPSIRLLPALLLAFGLSACGGDPAPADGDEAVETTDVALAPPDDAPAPTGDTTAGDTRLSAGDIAALATGLAAENAAIARLAETTPADDALYAAHVLDGMAAAVADGARAAGMDEDAYRRRKESLYTALGAIEMRALLEAQAANLDTTGLDEETIAGMRRQSAEMIAGIPDPYAGLDAEAAGTLRSRLDELMALRAANIGGLATLAR